jgi:L-ascorbate metabolism protein UlaG (beta-lactamase superfamily)
MKNTLLTLLLVLTVSLVANSQNRDTPDQYATDKSNLIVHPITHGTFAMEWNDLTIYIDPYGGKAGFAGLNAPNIVLITDIHGDHLDKNTLAELDLSKAKLIVPQAVMDMLPDNLKAQATVIANGEAIDIMNINISAIPMYNFPADAATRHPKDRGNGYVLTLGGKTIYISGDTEDIPEMRALSNIDIAFLCMNLPFTMDINQASSAVNEFKPKIIYPYHYRGSGGFADLAAFKELVKENELGIQVKLKNWYPQN